MTQRTFAPSAQSSPAFCLNRALALEIPLLPASFKDRVQVLGVLLFFIYIFIEAIKGNDVGIDKVWQYLRHLEKGVG